MEMPKRINEQFPQVKLVEMREAVKKKESYLMSNALLDAIYTRLQRKEQVILFVKSTWLYTDFTLHGMWLCADVSKL